MDVFLLIRAVAALAVTLGLIGLAAVALRRFGPDALNRLVSQRRERRLRVVETLVLDPARRLVLCRLDGEERLVLLGEGRLLDWIPAGPQAAPPSSEIQPEPAA
ncbi:flagellar biosynthetic protein FliO [Caulobacter hibisci]|uniref:Flagellar biosynthetic protein FliO n=1 Tax=Caulobacter hibisci TaxID=2035993 RepID=A0ABS0SZ18_9CAUL|nr:flagellar biosynthetic protein FliO [Caulobacter hibisci]MBI1683923.1 flagellar biosynthetic protein FliO [Caulobacter hibisci]